MYGTRVSFASLYCDKHLIARELTSVELPLEIQDTAIFQV